MLMISDSLRPLRQDEASISRGFSRYMPSGSNQARWPEAILVTVALWLFVLLIFLPIILDRHVGEPWSSLVLDAGTVFVSMLFAMPMFAIFRKTVDWPQAIRGLVLVTTVKQELQLSEARSAAQQAQLAALRYQLNPHFLFNALNSISALIVTRRNEDAERMTEKLSSFLRTSLSADPGELVPLEEELALIEEYLDIESVRFGERLNVSVDCSPGACQALVPSFLVQPLVENAIKHGVAPSRDPTEIAINASVEEGELCIVVRNCIAEASERANVRGRSGVGLQNVRRRLEAVYGKRASLAAKAEDDSYVATICIPEIQQAS